MAVASGRAGRVLARPPFSQRNVRNLLSLKTAVAHHHANFTDKKVHCKVFWLLQPYFSYLSCMHVCVCVHIMKFKECFQFSSNKSSEDLEIKRLRSLLEFNQSAEDLHGKRFRLISWPPQLHSFCVCDMY